MPAKPNSQRPSKPAKAPPEVFSLDDDEVLEPPPEVFSLDADANAEPVLGEVVELDAGAEPVMGEVVEVAEEAILGEVVEPVAPESAKNAVAALEEPKPAFGSGTSAEMAALAQMKESKGKTRRYRPVRPHVKITYVLPGQNSPFAV
jgi:hypothetical protein